MGEIPNAILSQSVSKILSKNPKVVIGLPVYNGENYLRDAIESILAQTFTDFKLIIADNASTDNTAAICREYAAQDGRIVYHRHPVNIGAARNHNFLFQPNDAPYFKWAAHDDTLEPDYLRQCVELLDQEPSLAIAHSRSYRIDGQGNKVGTYDHEVRLNGKRPSERFWRILWAGYFTEVFGVVRADLMAKTKLQGSYVGSDRNFVAEMLLLGDVGYVEEYLFCRRDHANCFVLAVKDNKDRLQWVDPKAKALGMLAGPIKLQEYLSAIARLPMPIGERIACVRMLLEWGLRRGIESSTGIGERFGEEFRKEAASSSTWQVPS